MTESWGWAGSVGRFLSTSQGAWLASLEDHHRRLLSSGASGSQRQAWSVEWEVVRGALRDICTAEPRATEWGVVFEYELPLEGGRRPDVVVLAGGSIAVLEFKSTSTPGISQIDQVEAYARDLSEYHEATHGRHVVPILVLPAADSYAEVVDDVIVTGPRGLAPYLVEASSEGEIDLARWLSAPYAPLPTLVAAARRIFLHEPLPHVRRALAEGIPETIDLLGRLVEDTSHGGGRLMVFVTGVPGAGKTLVGLRFVYERSDTEGRATFLSGNGPLVQVLQDALKSRVFVRDLHAFIRTYGMNEKVPKEQVLVFDEAQRAWDASFMRFKRGLDKSEPELLVEIGERIPSWSALVGLVGEGQEIHSGEEGGMAQWGMALKTRSSQTWRIHCPPKLATEFPDSPVEAHEKLDLTASLRSRRARDLHDWVQLLLEGSLALAARLGGRIQNAAYPMYVGRDLASAKSYVMERYTGEGEDKRYGLLVSSHAKLLGRFGVDNSFMATSRMNIAKWFNAEPDDPKSCCALTQPVTEFQCQGLELDLPIVCWGDDFTWSGRQWEFRAVRRKYPLDDPEQILKNTYRVLLTRGRDGTLIYVPDDRSLDATEHALLAAGVRPLPERLAEIVGQ